MILRVRRKFFEITTFPNSYAPDAVATDAAKQEKFLEGLNDELSMQLMVATLDRKSVV